MDNVPLAGAGLSYSSWYSWPEGPQILAECTSFVNDNMNKKFWSSLLWTVVSFVAGALVAAGTEIGQARLTTYRSGDPHDFKADLLALAVGTVIVFLLDIRKQRKS